MNVRPRSPAYASEYFHFVSATTIRDLQGLCSIGGRRIRADEMEELDHWSFQVRKFASALRRGRFTEIRTEFPGAIFQGARRCGFMA
jgi:hypothetical protein